MQSNWIAAFLIIGFLVYITLKGELASYKAVLFGPVPQGQSSTPPTTTANANAQQAVQNNAPVLTVGPGDALPTVTDIP